MTLKEAYKKCLELYRHEDQVSCMDSRAIIEGKINENFIYNVNYNTIRINYYTNKILCDDVNGKTPYICLYNKAYAVNGNNFAEIHYRKSSDFNKRPVLQDIKLELEKYYNIGNIMQSIKDYKNKETFLDKQLQNLKSKKDG